MIIAWKFIHTKPDHVKKGILKHSVPQTLNNDVIS